MRLYYIEYTEPRVIEAWKPNAEERDEVEYESVHVLAETFEEALSLFREKYGDKEIECMDLLNPNLTAVLTRE